MSTNTFVSAGTVVAAGTVHRPGWLELSGGTVVAAGTGTPPRPADSDRSGTAGGDMSGAAGVDFGDAIVVPGFVDMHAHGGGGASFTSGSPDDAHTVLAAHRAGGTTTMVASLVSAHPEPLAVQVAALAGLVEAGELAGIHLEGPWLSPKRLGAHDPTSLRPPDLDEVRRLLDAGRGTIRMVTIAPELPGGLAAIEFLRDAGVVVAVGHTEAGYQRTKDAIAAGATVGTHLFNAMRPIKHREPGPVVALMEDPGVVVEVIADGVHLHPVMYDQVRHWVGPQRIALVTDSMAAAGMPDGAYTLGVLDVTVQDGIARLTGSSTIAGGTATTGRLFRAAAGDPAQLDDRRLLDAVLQTSTVPARALGLSARDLSPGAPADLVVLSPDLSDVHVPRL